MSAKLNRKLVLTAAASLLLGIVAWSQNSTAPVPNDPAASPPNTARLPKEEVLPGNKGAESEQTKQASIAVTTTDPQAIRELARNNDVQVLRESPQPNGSTVVVLQTAPNSGLAQEINSQSTTKTVGQNRTYRALFTPNDPNYSGQWNLTKINMPQAWDITRGSSSVTIAVIDTGVLFSQQWGSSATFTQPDFPTSRRWENSAEKGATALEGASPNCTTRGLPLDKSCNNLDDDANTYVDDWQGWDFMGGWRGNSGCPNFTDGTVYEGTGLNAGYLLYDNDPQPYSCDSTVDHNQLNKDHYSGDCSYAAGACYIGHGTEVASIAAMAGNNAVLGAGVDHNAKIMNLRALDGYGFTDTSMVTSAVRYATSKGAQVINMSLAVTSCAPGDSDPALELAMTEAKTAGVTIVAASGNGGNGVVCYPASSSNAIAVGATNSSDNRASFSSYGPQLDVMAPGVDTPTANAPSAYLNTNYFTTGDGTSFATPHVAGLVALLKERSPTSTPDQIDQWLKQSADKVSGMAGQNRTDQYGYGRINAVAALNSIYSWAIESQEYSTGSYQVDPGQTLTITLKAKNTGTATWTKAGDYPMKLATNNPHDRSSRFYDASWPSPTRAALLTEATVAPGATGTFTAQVKAPLQDGLYQEHYNLVAEGLTWLPDPGMYFTFQVNARYTWQLIDQQYSTGTVNSDPGDTTTLTVTALNTGNATWRNSGNFPVKIGTWAPERRSAFEVPGWGSNIRPASLNQASVAPGQQGTFTFQVRSPYPGQFQERYNLVAEGLTWFNDTGMYFYHNVRNDYRWEIVSQEYSTGSTSIPNSSTATLTLRAKNIGASTWRDSGDFPVKLGTNNPHDRTSQFQHASWLSPSRPVALTEASVAPGQTGTFVFQISTPSSPGLYREHFNLVTEGITWLNDPGMYFTINVQ